MADLLVIPRLARKSMSTRPRVRASSKINWSQLYGCDEQSRLQRIRRIKTIEGENNVASGIWGKVHNPQGEFIGYYIFQTVTDSSSPGRKPSSTSITIRESEMNAFAAIGWVRSRTMGMPESKKLIRGQYHSPQTGELLGKLLPAEDAIEKAIEKVREFGRRRLVEPVRILALT
jgi:hypothetical protein